MSDVPPLVAPARPSIDWRAVVAAQPSTGDRPQIIRWGEEDVRPHRRLRYFRAWHPRCRPIMIGRAYMLSPVIARCRCGRTRFAGWWSW